MRTPVNLARVLRDVVDEIFAAHPDCTIEVDTRGEQAGEWDRDRLSQALSNLIGNAVQHGTVGSPVTVKLHGDGHQVTISVHNFGLAIRPDQLDGIFNPMKESTSSRLASSPTGSLGLGLYIAERIISAHEGRIEVDSAEGSGTTFTIRLPRYGNPRDAR